MALVRFAVSAALLPLAAVAVECYDFIVVGGGTAGNAVAARLSQQLPDSSVLVIEAGPYAPDEERINIPGYKGTTLGTKYGRLEQLH